VRTLLVIGIGPGDPEQITIQAVNALNRLDAVFVLDKRMDRQSGLRAEVCRRYITGPYRLVELADPDRDRTAERYADAVADWHERRAEVLEQAILAELADGQTGGLLVWGDSSLYDSTIRVVQRILARGAVDLDWSVVPGVTSVSALAARHRTTLNEIGGPVTLTTGRRLAADPTVTDGGVVVMLDGDLACRAIDDPAVHIWWGANLGTGDEELRSGPVTEVADDIAAARAALRERAGWVMDTYLLRRQ